MIDLALLRIIKEREHFDKVSRFIPLSAIDKRTKAIVQDIDKYFTINPDEVSIDFPSFRSLFFTSWHKGMKDDDCKYYNQLLTRMEEDVPDSVRKNIINSLLELEFATDMGNLLSDYKEGEEIEFVHAVDNLLAKVQGTMERTSNLEYAGFEDSTVGEEDDDNGLLWPLNSLNKVYRNVQGGDQTIIAARPGKGKTSLLTFCNWSFVQQMQEDKIIIWFNNESKRQRIMSRQIMSALNATTQECAKWKKEGTLRDRYVKVMGCVNRVRVYDVHGKANYQLEDILENLGDQVGLIIFDMLDNVKFPTLKEVREDQRLEQLYQWSREMGVKYNCPIFATSQISGEGDGLMFPALHMLKDSKTGKQGACDNILMLGSSADPLLEHKRGLSMPKTKTKRPGQNDILEEIIFDSDRGRFK